MFARLGRGGKCSVMRASIDGERWAFVVGAVAAVVAWFYWHDLATAVVAFVVVWIVVGVGIVLFTWPTRRDRL